MAFCLTLSLKLSIESVGIEGLSVGTQLKTMIPPSQNLLVARLCSAVGESHEAFSSP